jgi:CheY-like chemotaxis protein
MVVDDNDADVETISRGLLCLDSPPQVVVFRTASEALQALHTVPELSSATIPFVILVEANLPLVTGLEFVACMRCDASLRRIPVFVLTDSSLDSNKLAAHNLEVAGYLRKPTVPDESKAIAARLEAYVRSGNYPDKLQQAAHRRARLSCLPRRVTGASPAHGSRGSLAQVAPAQ